MLGIRIKGISLFRYSFVFRFVKQLGVHFNQSLSLVFDSTGIYSDTTKPSNLQLILITNQLDNELHKREDFIHHRLVEL